jgi:hypothetical protein
MKAMAGEDVRRTLWPQHADCIILRVGFQWFSRNGLISGYFDCFSFRFGSFNDLSRWQPWIGYLLGDLSVCDAGMIEFDIGFPRFAHVSIRTLNIGAGVESLKRPNCIAIG